jgi:hypothetical protein
MAYTMGLEGLDLHLLVKSSLPFCSSGPVGGRELIDIRFLWGCLIMKLSGQRAWLSGCLPDTGGMVW